MDAKEDQPTHVGALIRGATGELWFLRDDFEAPKPVENPEVAHRLNTLLPKEQEEQLFTFPMPQQVLDALEADFGPLLWCIVFLSARRLNR